MLFTSVLFQVSDHDVFQSGVVSRFTFSEQYLERTERALALAVLIVEVDGHINYPKFNHWVASSSRLWFHPIKC